MRYRETNDVSVTIERPTNGDPFAQVKSYAYPDGTVRNSLDADELREVAAMLEEAASEMEDGE